MVPPHMASPRFLSLYDQTKERDLLKHGRLYVAAGVIWGVAMLLGMAIFGINWGIDFAGGMEMQVKLEQKVEPQRIRVALEKLGFEKHQVQQYGSEADNEWLVRVERVAAVTPDQLKAIETAITGAVGGTPKVDFDPKLGDRVHLTVAVADTGGDAVAMMSALQEQTKKIGEAVSAVPDVSLRKTRAPDGTLTTENAVVRDEPYQGRVEYTVMLQGVADRVAKGLIAEIGNLEVRRVDFVDATVAEELKTDGVIALVLSLALILIYVAVRFDMFFAPGAVIALLHDPLGALAVYVVGRMEFDLPSVAALLTTIGYSISHTIVIYDRVRATMPPAPPGGHDNATVRKVVNDAVNHTLNRTINTTTTVLFTTVAIWILGHGSLRAFAACLTVGCAIGAYSSAFMAPTFYLWLRERFYKAPTQDVRGITREDRARGVV